ncbi:MAG: NAD(P)/FAD-dependent oxidoreductase [Blastocatellia bacterium]
MKRILIAGGGFGGVTVAEALAKRLEGKHQITLLSRDRHFVFYPALVRLAFGGCELGEVSFDLEQAMRERGVAFVQAEIAHPDPGRRALVIRRDGPEEALPYDYCVLAPGRRLVMDHVPGFAECAHHLLTVEAALKFRKAVRNFQRGEIVLGWCRDARLAVPVFETAFALDRLLTERGDREHTQITVVCPENIGELLGGPDVIPKLQETLDNHGIRIVPFFPVERITKARVIASDGEEMRYDLLMLIPPFRGPDPAMYTGLADPGGYIRVNKLMQATGADRVYAVGDCVNLPGPKSGHMAVLQAEVAAANLAAEIHGHAPVMRYEHEMMLVIDEGGKDSLFLQRDLWTRERAHVSQNQFWGFAKEVNRKHWQRLHS